MTFADDITFELGPDPDGEKFGAIVKRMLSGHFYPPDVITVYGRFQQEARALKPGDRILQEASIMGIKLYSATEIYVAERSENACRLGYVTTRFHHGRGVWTAELTRAQGNLRIRIHSITQPQSWLFWIALPVARYYQLRARRRAVEEFRTLLARRTPQSHTPASDH